MTNDELSKIGYDLMTQSENLDWKKIASDLLSHISKLNVEKIDL